MPESSISERLSEQSEEDGSSDAEDILSTSLQTLYGLSPIAQSSAGSRYVYTLRTSALVHLIDKPNSLTVSLQTPDTSPANWSLHASSIWVSALFLADHLEDLHLNPPLNVLELGAGAGLPSILIAKVYKDVHVTASDYPDEKLMTTLSDNVKRNGVDDRCQAVAYAWGSDIAPLTQNNIPSRGSDSRFDVIIAADTLWNSELHVLFIESLRVALKKSSRARVHLVAGFHTGRYTIQSFLQVVSQVGFDAESAIEREVDGDAQRTWDVARAEAEDERERRRWVVWIVLKWKQLELE